MIERPAPGPWRMSRRQYEKLGETDFFGSKRLELVDGFVLMSRPISPARATCVVLCVQIVRRVYGEGYIVRCRMPLAVGDWSEPDIAVVKGNARDFEVHPTTAELVIEVADSSLELDRNVKPVLYAKAGVTEYWLVDLNGRCVEVYREPDETAGVYRQRRIAKEGERLAAMGREDVEIVVREILP